MIFSPVITRLYGPEAFGLLGIYTAILAVMIPLVSCSYPIAIVLPKKEIAALGLAKLSIIIAMVVTFVTTLVLLLFKTSIVRAFNIESIEPFILLLPLAMLFSALMTVTSQWVIRKGLFKIKAKAAVIHALLLNLMKIGIGVLAPFASVLIALATLSGALHTILLLRGIRESHWKKEKTPVELENRFDGIRKPNLKSNNVPVRSLALKYKRLAFYRTPQELISSSTQNIPIVMLAYFFGPTSAGFYTLGRMVLMMPTNLIGKSVNDVLYPKISEIYNSGKSITGVLLKTTFTLLAVGLIPYSLIFVFGPWIFELIFGQEWGVAGEYARWLSLMLLFNFANKPCVSAIPVLGIDKLFLIYGIFSGIMRVAGIGVGYFIWNTDVASVLVFSVFGMVAYIILLCIVIKCSILRDRNLRQEKTKS